MEKQSDGSFKCSYCGYTGKEGYVRNHERLKHGGGKDDSTRKERDEKTKKNDETKSEKCPDCGGKFRLLNSGDRDERNAIHKGFTKICNNCEEII